jgi:hypothetical protein
MKGKTLLSFAIVLAMLAAIIPIAPIAAAPTPSMKIVFNDTATTTYDPAPPVCNNFVVTLKIFDVPAVPGVIQWMARIRWNPALLSLVGNPTEGTWLKNVGSTTFLYKNIIPGQIGEMTCILMVAASASGSGDLAYMTFHVDAVTYDPAGTWIEIYDSALVGSDGNPMAHDIVNGQLIWHPLPPTPPEAAFTPPTCTFVYVGDTVNLDGSSSTGGWDTIPVPGEYCPIQTYSWEIDFGNDGSIDLYLDGMQTSFVCLGPGDVAITLIVYAPDPTAPDTAPSYAPYNNPAYRDAHNTETHVIHQVPRPIGPNIDVYTNRGGTGPGIDPSTGLPYAYHAAWSDAFGPQEEVTVYAKVTYNDEPVENKPVGFEIVDPTGVSRDFRVAFTDANGIATTTFRIPWQGSNAEDMFGDWTIVGTVDIAGTIVKDICKFRFGYILSIRDVVVSNSPLKKMQNLGVAVDIQNISFDSKGKDAKLTITLYDECGVPIGVAWDSITVAAEDGMTSIYQIQIPSWAFVGTGHVYVNLFTNYPYFGGVPYCPEGEAIFIINKT